MLCLLHWVSSNDIIQKNDLKMPYLLEENALNSVPLEDICTPNFKGIFYDFLVLLITILKNKLFRKILVLYPFLEGYEV